MATKIGLGERLWEAVRRKWNNLCGTYKKKKDLAGPKNSGRGGAKPCAQYEMMDSITGDSPAVQTKYVLATAQNTKKKPTAQSPVVSSTSTIHISSANVTSIQRKSGSCGHHDGRQRQRASSFRPGVTRRSPSPVYLPCPASCVAMAVQHAVWQQPQDTFWLRTKGSNATYAQDT